MKFWNTKFERNGFLKEELLSVGIDIGTSTTQLIFSKLFIENMASSYTVPRIVIVDKQIIYRSQIYFTPLLSLKEIDGEKIRQIIQKEYETAGIDKSSIHTGAVIITGETARKENAKEVLENLSGFAGDFVVATAGPDLESVIAGKGAGAHIYAKEHNACIVNIDIGGGTSNFAVFQRGDIKETGCMDIGGRLIKVDSATHKITYIAPKLETIIKQKEFQIELGMVADRQLLSPIIEIMVKALEQGVGLKPKDDTFYFLTTEKSFNFKSPITCVSFSGGVADFIYENKKEEDCFAYGDIGILLGQALKQSELFKHFTIVKSSETIRATVVGAGTHTTEISGSTITYTKNIFPLKNLPILKLSLEEEALDSENFSKTLLQKLDWFKLEGELQKVAVALEGMSNPSFYDIQRYAKGLVEGMKELIEKEIPFVVIVEKDMAKVLGQSIYHLLEFKKDIVCLDSIHLENGDYIDIGSPVANGAVVPVVVKTLVFHG